MIYKIFNNLIR